MATPYGHRTRIGLPGTVNAMQRLMMLHITVTESKNGSIGRLSGYLAGEFVAEADRACAAVDGPLVIDADQLQSADAEGLAWLVKNLDRGVQVGGLSGYLEMRLSYLRGTEP